MSNFIINSYIFGAAEPVLISQGTGTNEHDAASRETAWFDGTTSQTFANATIGGDNSTLNLGKDYSASPKTITGFKAWSSSDQGFYQNNGTPSTTVDLILKGSNTAFKDAGATTIYSSTGHTEANGLSVDENNAVPAGSGPWDHVWLEIEASGDGSSRSVAAEVEFYEPG